MADQRSKDERPAGFEHVPVVEEPSTPIEQPIAPNPLPVKDIQEETKHVEVDPAVSETRYDGDHDNLVELLEQRDSLITVLREELNAVKVELQWYEDFHRTGDEWKEDEVLAADYSAKIATIERLELEVEQEREKVKDLGKRVEDGQVKAERQDKVLKERIEEIDDSKAQAISNAEKITILQRQAEKNKTAADAACNDELERIKKLEAEAAALNETIKALEMQTTKDKKKIQQQEVDIKDCTDQIRALEAETAAQNEKAKNLEQQAQADRVKISQQQATIKSQGGYIKKTPAPNKNEMKQREMMMMMQQTGGVVRPPMGPVISARNVSTSVLRPKALPPNEGGQQAQSNWHQRRPSLRASPMPLGDQQQSSTETRQVRFLSGGGFQIPQHFQVAASVSEASGRGQQPDVAQVGASLENTAIVEPPPSLQVRSQTQADLEQPPNVEDQAWQWWEAPLPSAEVSLADLGQALSNLFGKVEQWASRYAAGPSNANISPLLVQTIQSCKIDDQHGASLIRHAQAKPLLVARIVNSHIKAVFLTSDLLRSINQDFNDQVGRTFAQVQGQEGPIPVGLRQNVMNNIASLFRSLPKRVDWNAWKASKVPTMTTDLYSLIETLVSDDTARDLDMRQRALGQLMEMVSEAIDVSVLMFSQPFLYEFPFAEVGLTFDPQDMVVLGLGDVSEASLPGTVVSMAISPAVVVWFWHDTQLVAQRISLSEVI